MTKISRLSLTVLMLFFMALVSCQPAGGSQKAYNSLPGPKNIIFFIGDGMGFNHVLAANYFEHGVASAQVYEQDDWFQGAVATYNAITRIEDGDTTYTTGYNPRLAWSSASYLNRDYTGSAEGATAFSTGRKTFATSIGLGPLGDTLVHISQAAKALGKSAGVVTTVPFSHATPAGFAAHVNTRHDYGLIAKYMLFNTRLDLIMGVGNPDYDNNGRAPEKRNARYIHSLELWEQLKANDGRTAFELEGKTYRVQDSNGDGQPDAWTLIESRDEFQALARGKTPTRVLGIPKAYSSAHYGRDHADNETQPFSQPFNDNVPNLEEMTLGALNMLSKNPNGFFVMIEGGAIDWAGHDNLLGRLIEEQIDFNHAVQAAVEWVEKYSNWQETLIIVTSDHETGYLTGPDHPGQVAQAVVNQGRGMLPLAKFNSTDHTNMLVPLYAKGPGTHILKLLSSERDPVRGPFLQNTDLGNAIFLMWGKPEVKVFYVN